MKCILILSLLITFNCKSQQHFRPEKRIRDQLALLVPKEYGFNQEELAVIDACNTAKHSPFHTDVEKEFILLMNLARTNSTVLQSFISHRYDSSFWNQLPTITSNNSKPLLKVSFGLHLSAKVHAKKSGKRGTIGHQNMDRRIKAFNFYFKAGMYGENCNYSSRSHPLTHFLSLMNSKQHFANIMRAEFNSVGVSFQPHIKFGVNSVSCFGKK